MDNAASTTILDYSGYDRHASLDVSNSNTKSATGPSSYLTSSILFDGEKVTTPVNLSLSDFTVLMRFRDPGTIVSAAERLIDKAFTVGFWLGRASGEPLNRWGGGVLESDPPYGVFLTFPDDVWNNIAMSRSGSVRTLYANKASSSDTVSATATSTNTMLIGGGGGIPLTAWGSDASVFSRAIASSEENEWEDGPEPIVVSGADTVSGPEQVGGTLSASGATWGLDSPFGSGTNGTITYTYQWTRSDDNTGTNEVDISGATSSTYTLQPADVGKYIRRRTRATNDGGYDSAADHNSTFTGAIASLGGDVVRPFRRAFTSPFASVW